VFVHTGDTVKQGQPLFRLDSTDLVQAINNVVVGKALWRKRSRSHLTRGRGSRPQLYSPGGALKDWQQAQADLTAAQNDLKSAEIGSRPLRPAAHHSRSIRETTRNRWRGPLPIERTGSDQRRGAERKLGVGQYISQGATDPIMLIGDLSTVWLVANVRETDAPFVRVASRSKCV